MLGAAVQIYIQGVGATWTVTQRAEMQQDFRAASNMLTKDLSLAGAGLGQRRGDRLALWDHSGVRLRSDPALLSQRRCGEVSRE